MAVPAGVRVVTSQFEAACAEIEKTAKRNTRYFGETMAQAFQTTARRNAAWTDRRGVARRGLYGRVTVRDGKLVVEMGGTAPNYKKKSVYTDYMELLEWGHESLGRNFPKLSVVYPTYELIKADFARQYGDAVFSGVSYRMERSAEASRQRSKLYRRRQHDNYYAERRKKTKGMMAKIAREREWRRRK